MEELEERAADQVVRALGARRWIRRDLGGIQMRDFDIEFRDGRQEPLEVTLDAEAGVVQTWERIERQQFDPVELQRRWLIGPEFQTDERGRAVVMDVAHVRRELESILLELERAGFESFDTSRLMYGPTRRPELGRRLMALGVHHGFSSQADPNDETPMLWISTGLGGIVDPVSITESVERLADLADNQRKLAARPDAPRRHLFVHLGASHGLAAFALLNVVEQKQPLPPVPELPDAITTVWAGVGSHVLFVTPPQEWQIAFDAGREAHGRAAGD